MKEYIVVEAGWDIDAVPFVWVAHKKGPETLVCVPGPGQSFVLRSSYALMMSQPM